MIRVIGKGNKERFVYFGSACRKAIDAHLPERNQKVLTDNRALFGSRDNNRISVTAVHRLVKKALLQAGLDSTQYSAHKLRHTAATMMLSGGVTPRESMPAIVQNIMLAAPATYFVRLAQAILYRGAGFDVIWRDLLAMTGVGAVFFGVALVRFRKAVTQTQV